MVRLNDLEQVALAELVVGAQTAFEGVTNGTARLLNDLYTGRDPSAGTQVPLEGVSFSEPVDPLKVGGRWDYPQIGANLVQSRIRQLVPELVPAVPAFHVEPIVAEATGYAEDQNKLSLWASRRGDLKQAARESALNGILGSHFGIKVVINKEAPNKEDRLKFQAIPSSHCGYEPKYDRFKWHTFQCQWRDLPADQRPKLPTNVEMKPWQIVTKTEVYHQGFQYNGAGCPMSVFISIGQSKQDPQQFAPGNSPDLTNEPLGEYVTTVDLPACPLHIDSFLDPAPGEYIAPPEVTSWVPIIRSIHADIHQIEREVGRINNVILYDKETFDPAHIAAIAQNPSGNEIYLAVDTSAATQGFERDNGVSHKMRPVERNSALGELTQALATHLMLFDEVVGAGSLNDGVAQGPRKSAAEASILAQAGSRRSRDRLSVIASMLSAAGQSAFAFQRKAYGRKIAIPSDNGVIHNIVVPNPRTARMAFRVDAVELGNLSKQGQVETHSASLTLLTNLRAQAPNVVDPAVLVSEAQHYLRALGNHEAADRLKVPAQRGGPADRLRDFLYGRTVEIPVFEQDDHQQFIAAYQDEIALAVSQPSSAIPVGEIQSAIQRHQEFATAQAPAQAAPQAPVSGFNTNGQPSNDVLAALQSGSPPFESPGNLTTF